MTHWIIFWKGASSLLGALRIDFLPAAIQLFKCFPSEHVQLPVHLQRFPVPYFRTSAFLQRSACLRHIFLCTLHSAITTKEDKLTCLMWWNALFTHTGLLRRDTIVWNKKDSHVLLYFLGIKEVIFVNLLIMLCKMPVPEHNNHI